MIPARSLPHRRIQVEQVEAASVDELAGWLVSLEDESALIEQNRAVVLAEFDQRGGHHVFEHPSAVSFLKDVCRMSGARAGRLVKKARAAAAHAATLAAWRFGQISTDQADQLFRISDELPDRFPDAEHTLLDIAGETPDETRITLDYWKNTVDPAGVALDLDTQLERRSFEITAQPNGMVTGRFMMTGIAGEALKTAVTTLLPPPGPLDDRSATQRRHDAVEDLALSFLETTNTVTAGGERPHISVHCDLDALGGEPGGLHETTDGTVLTVATIRQLACERLHHQDRLRTRIRSPRPRPQNPDGLTSPTTSSDRPRPPLHHPRMPPTRHLVRRPPQDSLGRRRRNNPQKPRPPLPLPPHPPPPTRLSRRRPLRHRSSRKCDRRRGAETTYEGVTPPGSPRKQHSARSSPGLIRSGSALRHQPC